jgi:Putative addiction module component
MRLKIKIKKSLMYNYPRFLAATDQHTIIATDGNNFAGFDEIAISKAWAIEIKKRRADIASGKSKLVPWEEAKARLSLL